ncbi:MAG: hypothetical protein R3C53_02370 [Pirellulaceae bacterium]
MNQAEPLPRSQSPVSIAFLFYLVTLAAIISACLRTLFVSENVTSQLVVALVSGGTLLGLICGGSVGFFYLKTILAGVVGMLVGACVGALAGCLALVQHSHFAEVSLTAYLGCWLLICVMLVVARNRNDQQL